MMEAKERMSRDDNMKLSGSFITNSREEALSLVKQFRSDGAMGGESPTERQLSTSSTTITGYPASINRRDYENMFKRTIGGSIINKKADDTFREWFTVETEMEGLAREIEVMNRNLQAWRVFRLADIFARLDGYSIIFMGIRDGKNIAEPLERAQGIEYLRAYRSYQIARIERNKDKQSPTYGEPVSIIIRVGSDERTIHISRILVLCEEHLGDPFSDSIPALERAYDYIQSLENLAWASSEGAFQRVVPPWHVKFEERPDSDVESDIDNQLDNFRTGVRQRIKTAGVTIEPLVGSGQMVPVDKIETMLMRLVSASVDIPQRMLFGSEAGQLSSASEDVRAYYAGISARQENYAEPVIRTFFNRLQSAGVLPDGEFSLTWNPLFEMSEQEKNLIEKNIGIDLANRSRTAWLLSGSGQYEPLLSKEVILEKILGWNPEDVKKALGNMKVNMIEEPKINAEAGNQARLDSHFKTNEFTFEDDDDTIVTVTEPHAKRNWEETFIDSTSLQDKYVKILEKFFVKQGKLILKRFSGTSKTINDTKSLFLANTPVNDAIAEGEAELAEILKNMSMEATDKGAKGASMVAGGRYVQLEHKAILAISKNSAKMAGEISKTTRDKVSSAMITGMQKGEGTPQIAQRIRGVMDASSKRANTIARTGVIGSINTGQFDQYQENMVEFKQWLTAGDSKVRPSHAQVHMKIVPIDEFFDNGMMHPGDSSASAGKLVNCRCSIAPYIPLPKEGQYEPVVKRDSMSWEDNMVKSDTPVLWKRGDRNFKSFPEGFRKWDPYYAYRAKGIHLKGGKYDAYKVKSHSYTDGRGAKRTHNIEILHHPGNTYVTPEKIFEVLNTVPQIHRENVKRIVIHNYTKWGKEGFTEARMFLVKPPQALETRKPIHGMASTIEFFKTPLKYRSGSDVGNLYKEKGIARVLAHEIGHHTKEGFGHQILIKGEKTWIIKDRKNYERTIKKGGGSIHNQVSEYARINQVEEFAETYSYYMTGRLDKKKYPGKFIYFEKMFGDMERSRRKIT